MFQLRLEHEEALIALHSILAYFGARHCPSDEACLDRQWRHFAQGVTDIMEDPAYTADTRIVEIVRWGRDYLPVSHLCGIRLRVRAYMWFAG